MKQASANADFWGWITGSESTATTTNTTTTTTTTVAPTTTTTSAPSAANTTKAVIYQTILKLLLSSHSIQWNLFQAASFNIFDPLGIFSNTMAAVGGAVQATGSSLASATSDTTNFFLNPFGIFGSTPIVKIDILACLENMVKQIFSFLLPIGNLLPSCAFAADSNMWQLATTLMDLIAPIQAAFINSMLSLFSCRTDLNACVNTVGR